MRTAAPLTLIAVSAFSLTAAARGSDEIGSLVKRLATLAATDTDVETKAVAADLAFRLAPISLRAREARLGGLGQMKAAAREAMASFDPDDPAAPRAVDVGDHTVRWLSGPRGRMVVEVAGAVEVPRWFLARTFVLGPRSTQHLGTSMRGVTGDRVSASWTRAEPSALTIDRDRPTLGTSLRFRGASLHETVRHDKARDVLYTRDRAGNVHVKDVRTGRLHTIRARERVRRR